METQYIVNMSFEDEKTGVRYSSGQTLTQIEYNMLAMQYKVRCSINFHLKADPGEDNGLFPRA